MVRGEHTADYLLSDGELLRDVRIVTNQYGHLTQIYGTPCTAPHRYDMPDVWFRLMLPGFVNNHVHLSYQYSPLCSPLEGDMFDWLRRITTESRSISTERRREILADNVQLCLAGGNTTVLENTPFVDTVAELCDSLRCRIAVELFGTDPSRAEAITRDKLSQLKPLIERFGDIFSLAPHSIYNLSRELLREIFSINCSREWLTTMHFAELPCERLLLNGERDAALDAFHRSLGVARLPDYAQTDLSGLLRQIGVEENTAVLFTHVIHLSASEHALLQEKGIQVISCPRSNLALHGQMPRFHDMASFAIGSDSLYSNNNYDLLQEMRLLYDGDTSLSPATLLSAATTVPARQLGMQDRLGQLKEGFYGDFQVFELQMDDEISPDSIMRSLMTGHGRRVAVYVDGLLRWQAA